MSDPFEPDVTLHPVPGVDGVRVRVIPASEAEMARDLFANADDDEVAVQIGLCILACCTEDGARMFTRDDEERLRAAPLRVVRACAGEAMRVNGFSEAPEGN